MTAKPLTAADYTLIDGRYGLAEFIFANDSTKLLSDATVLAEKIVSSWLPEIVRAATERGREAGRNEQSFAKHAVTRHHGVGVSDGRRRF